MFWGVKWWGKHLRYKFRAGEILPFPCRNFQEFWGKVML